ncbi:MAG: hypothetical protein MK212_08820 [Saprospiraceae bacterium]|nr:hypothetical protein [Saprospiraceae bacterium]
MALDQITQEDQQQESRSVNSEETYKHAERQKEELLGGNEGSLNALEEEIDKGAKANFITLTEHMVALGVNGVPLETMTKIDTAFANNQWKLHYLKGINETGKIRTIDHLALATGLVTGQGKGKADPEEIKHYLSKSAGTTVKEFNALSADLKDQLYLRLQEVSKKEKTLGPLIDLAFAKNTEKDDNFVLAKKQIADLDAIMSKHHQWYYAQAKRDKNLNQLTAALTQWMKEASVEALQTASAADSSYHKKLLKLKNESKSGLDTDTQLYQKYVDFPKDTLSQRQTDPNKDPKVNAPKAKTSGDEQDQQESADPLIIKAETEQLVVQVNRFDTRSIKPSSRQANAEGLVEAIQEWISGASKEAREAAFAPGSEYEKALHKIYDKIGTGVTKEIYDYLRTAVKPGGTAVISKDKILKAAQQDKTENEQQQEQEERDDTTSQENVTVEEQPKIENAEDLVYNVNDLTSMLDNKVKFNIVFSKVSSLSGQERKTLTKVLGADLDNKLAYFEVSEIAKIKGILDQTGEVGPNYSRLVELLDGKKEFDKKLFNTRFDDVAEIVVNLSAKEVGQVQQDKNLWNAMTKIKYTGDKDIDAAVSHIHQIFGIQDKEKDLSSLNEMAPDDLEKNVAQQPSHYSAKLNFELEDHTFDANILRGKLAGVLYDAQKAAVEYGGGDKAKSQQFVNDVLGGIKRKKELQEQLQYDGMDLYADFEGMKLSSASLMKFSRRGLVGHGGEVLGAIENATPQDLLSMSNYDGLIQLLKDRKAMEEEDKDPGPLNEEIDAYVIDLNPDIRKTIEAELGSVTHKIGMDGRNESSANAVGALRKKLAEAVESDMAGNLSVYMSDWERSLMATRITAMSALEGEELSNRGIQYNIFSVKSVERRAAIAEFKGLHKNLEGNLRESGGVFGGPEEGDKADARKTLAEGKVQDIKQAEETFERRKASFDEFKATYDEFFVGLASTIVSIAISAAISFSTFGVGTIATELIKFAIQNLGQKIIDAALNWAIKGTPTDATSKEALQGTILTAFDAAISTGIAGLGDTQFVGQFKGLDKENDLLKKGGMAVAKQFFGEQIGKPIQYAVSELVSKEEAFGEIKNDVINGLMSTVVSAAGTFTQTVGEGLLEKWEPTKDIMKLKGADGGHEDKVDGAKKSGDRDDLFNYFDNSVTLVGAMVPPEKEKNNSHITVEDEESTQEEQEQKPLDVNKMIEEDENELNDNTEISEEQISTQDKEIVSKDKLPTQDKPKDSNDGISDDLGGKIEIPEMSTPKEQTKDVVQDDKTPLTAPKKKKKLGKRRKKKANAKPAWR